MNQIQEYTYTVKSEKSKETYEKYFAYFTEWSRLSPIDLLKLPQKKIEDTLIKYVIHMRDRDLSNSTIKGRMAPIIAFLELNDILVNKKKIKKYYGEEKKTVKDLAYTSEDIQKLLSVAKLRLKVMILVYSSTGIRRDAILDLKLKHLEKVPQLDLYRVTVYENSKEEYITFTTPECGTMIDLYLKHRQQSGEIITKESYLVRNDYDYFVKDMSKNPRPVTSVNLNTLFRHLLIKTGLRDENQPMYDRHEKAIFHAFRKFFTNQLRKAGVKTELRWLLEGHALPGNDPNYVRIEVDELYQEYQKAIDNLTINEENRLRKKVKILEVEKSEIESLQSEFAKFKQEVALMKQRKSK